MCTGEEPNRSVITEDTDGNNGNNGRTSELKSDQVVRI
jgi:hypothetical protein